jgi:CRP-like cAMP-binding protein
MITYEKVLVLKNIVLFEKASELALSDVIQAASEKTMKPGEILLEKDQENDALYIVLSGALELNTLDNQKILINPRQMLGETTVFAPAKLGNLASTCNSYII